MTNGLTLNDHKIDAVVFKQLDYGIQATISEGVSRFYIVLHCFTCVFKHFFHLFFSDMFSSTFPTVGFDQCLLWGYHDKISGIQAPGTQGLWMLELSNGKSRHSNGISNVLFGVAITILKLLIYINMFVITSIIVIKSTTVLLFMTIVICIYHAYWQYWLKLDVITYYRQWW